MAITRKAEQPKASVQESIIQYTLPKKHSRAVALPKESTPTQGTLSISKDLLMTVIIFVLILSTIIAIQRSGLI